MPLLILPILWVATAAGRRLNLFVVKGSPAGILPIERSLFGLATGLGVLAYGVLALGLLRLLSPVPVALWIVGLAVIGWREHAALARDIAGGVRGLRVSPWGTLAGIAFAACAFVSLVGCFCPPTALEWDSISYHLADPKIYLQHHRILYLPWESHSNFAFTMEMLYSIGLMAHSIPLAKLFHFTLAVVATIVTYLIAAKIVSRAAGVVAALIFASIPLVMWEAGTAYVDLGATGFGALGLLALVSWAVTLRSVKESNSPLPGGEGGRGGEVDSAAEGREAGTSERVWGGEVSRWMWLSAIMMGWMVSVKATSLIPTCLFALFVLVTLWRSRGAAVAWKSAVLYGIVAVLVGCVWYIKSWLYTGNPFYPFAYSVFGGRYWSSYNALQYALSQKDFGVGHRPIDLLTLPWNLTMSLMPGHFLPAGLKGFNDYQSFSTAIGPVLLAALFAPAFIRMKSSPWVAALAIYSLLSIVIWFFLTQQVRYLLPLVPALCVLAAWVLVELWNRRALAGYALGGLLAVSVAGSLIIACFVDPTWIPAQAPVAFGAEPKSQYLARFFAPYAAMEYINTTIPAGAKVVLYGEPQGFYCDREYIWGDPGHSLLIPYDRLRTSQALAAYLKQRGYDYILINYTGAPVRPGPGWAGMVWGLTAGSGAPPIFQDRDIAIYRI